MPGRSDISCSSLVFRIPSKRREALLDFFWVLAAIEEEPYVECPTMSNSGPRDPHGRGSLVWGNSPHAQADSEDDLIRILFLWSAGEK